MTHSKHDLLERREVVETLTRLVSSIQGPCVVAVDAPWGAGKSTFLNIWSQHLRDRGFQLLCLTHGKRFLQRSIRGTLRRIDSGTS